MELLDSGKKQIERNSNHLPKEAFGIVFTNYLIRCNYFLTEILTQTVSQDYCRNPGFFYF